jgi:cytoskeleton-associated protein 5
MQELQIEFDRLDLNGVDKPRQTRFLRSQQDLKQKMEETSVPSSVVIEDTNPESKFFGYLMFYFFVCVVQEDIDPFEMMEPVNILERLSKDFFEKIVS